ncbi:MAG: glycosyltransferase [Anaerolineae bacterium]|nr:glycosyltransferase [Anaerolineae bacterium]
MSQPPGPAPQARISVVITVLNEAESLPGLLESLAVQTLRPDEIIICDGGSTDSTMEVLTEWQASGRLPLVVLQRKGNISQGRNAAIEAATGDIVAVTDAGVRLSPRWLEELAAPFGDSQVQAVAGFFLPDPQTVFETAMGATVLPELVEIKAARFLPSSRSVAFRKTAWAAVGGYPEWLDYCEDLIFDLRLRKKYGPFIFAPEALVYFRPRSNLRDFFIQYYRYARGDGKADLWRMRHAIRYATYLVAVPAIALAGAALHPAWWLLYLIAVPGMFWPGWRRLRRAWKGLNTGHKLQAALLVPLIRVTGDVAKMIGYPVGIWWRLRHRASIPDWRVL